jgi:hypothetical protein
VFVVATLILADTKNRGSAQEVPSQGITPSIDFPEGTATPSEVCGVCHQAIYREYREGFGSDLHWSGMKPFPASERALTLPDSVPSSATAHSVAGIDPFPLDAVRVEQNGKRCIVCHYPTPLAYPALWSERIEKPRPRLDNQAAGITCASCHLTPEGKIRGPYDLETPAPHETVKDERIQTSVACATCHSEGARVVGKQTQTFLEWREDFMKAGLGPQQCQDCHMPKTRRKLAEDFDVPERVVARHLWMGGHSFQRVQGALGLVMERSKQGQPGITFHVTNSGAGHSVPTGSNRRAIYLTAEIVDPNGEVVARREWMFAPSFANRPDDRKFLSEDMKGPEPVATTQADAQGPHETIIRAGEDRVLNWQPALDDGGYTVRATLSYDLNRYNDRAFKDDQYEIGRASLPIEVTAQPAVPRLNRR